jgi:DNA invertase Pin-like site-specific DNA recombinase
MTVYGYARVSTDGQSLNAQRDALSEAGCGKIFREKDSVAIAALDAGDVLVVTRLDRLARSTRDLLNTLHTIAERKAGFKSLADTWADTTTPHGKLILTMLGGLAEFERSLIIARTTAGRATAKANGTKFGRQPKLTPHQVKEIVRRIEAGESQSFSPPTYACRRDN